MKRKVILIQRIIPHYRIDFFNQLYVILKKINIDLIIIHSSSNISNNNFLFYLKPTYEKNIKNLLDTRIVVTFKLFRYLKNHKPDLIITEDISNLPNGLIVSFYAKIHRCKYIIIGLGQILSKKPSILKKIFYFPIEFFRNNASSFIAYSNTGSKYYSDNYSKKAISWNNSVCNISDITKINTRNKYLEKKLKILFIGRIEVFKKLDLLIDSLESINFTNVTLNVIGDGAELDYLKLKYKDSCININWHGRIIDKYEKEKYLNEAHLAVMPGNGGLVIQELQSYGIPVIASYSDGTEIDLIKNINPELFIEQMNINSLIDKIEYFIKSDIEKKISFSRKAYNIVRDEYSVDNMLLIISKVIKDELDE